MDQLQPMTSEMQYVQMVPVGSVSSTPTSIQSLQPNDQMTIHEPTSQYGGDGGVSQNVSSNGPAPPMMPMTNYSDFQQLTIPDIESGDAGAIFSNLKPQTNPMPVKRKSPMEKLSEHLLSPREVKSAKKIGQLEHRPWLNVYSSNQSNAEHQVQSLAGVLASQWAAKKKRTTQFQPGPFKLGFQKFSAPRSRPIQGHATPRVQNESNEIVRSKLRESISAALALVTETNNSLYAKDASSRAGAVAPEQMQEVSQSAEFASSVAAAVPSFGKPNVAIDYCSTESEPNMKSQLTALPSNVNGSSLSQTHESVSNEFNVIDMLPDEESIAGNFFVKDDLLQGNGLSWMLDFDTWVAEKEGHELENKKVGEVVDGAQEVKKINSPQTLALQIELELFKLFDGVNKKYKEKGRSLLFNLKDKNNPELREKVMSGEISPGRLCSMTAEELASKELSEWRKAKSDEFEQMKILPDSDIDIRRLVKKTHKGEYQVEVEEDDVSVEVSVGSSSLPRNPAETEAKSPSGQISDGGQMEAVNNTNSSEEHKRCGISIPSNSDDLTRGIIEDEFKDAEFLPPIVSLDEFMESLHKEPPFENLSADTDKTEVTLNNVPSEAVPETKAAELSPDGHTGATTKTRHKADSGDPKLDAGTKPTDIQLVADVSPPVTVSKGEQIWEGILQLSNSSKISMGGFFKSGEKASTKDWPRSLEIKGRVRLDAFEKFLHDLHKSRSRALMVIHLILEKKEGKESEYLSQVVESYISDNRVGFAEPVRGLEAYLCPFHPKIMDRIVKHLSKEQSEALYLADGDKGLVGVIVWRKANASPNSSSLHKSLKKHQQEHNTSTGRRHNHQQDRNMNVNSSNPKPKHPSVPFVSPKITHSFPIKADAVEDDVPPGFGPPASQEDDDLPEFNFSSGLRHSVSTQKPIMLQYQNRPADQMRQLVKKYGQNAGSGLVVKPWEEEEEDDDIPEWQPPQLPLPSATRPNYQSLSQPVLQHLINQQQQVVRSPLQQPQASVHPQAHAPAIQQNIPPSWLLQQQQQTGLWMNPQGPQQGEFYGTQSRGF